jgi:hypothetical protein
MADSRVTYSKEEVDAKIDEVKRRLIQQVDEVVTFGKKDVVPPTYSDKSLTFTVLSTERK